MIYLSVSAVLTSNKASAEFKGKNKHDKQKEIEFFGN